MPSQNSRGVRSQTLERALESLEVLADGRPRTSHELAEAVGLPRSNVYRILRTFEEFAFVTRTADGRYTLGLGLAALAETGLRDAELRLDDTLSELADATSATAIFCIPQKDHAVVLTSARPSSRPASVASRRSTRLPLDDGAPGMAVLALRAKADYEPDEVSLARSTGYVHTKGAPFPGFEAVACPVRLRDQHAGSIGVVFPLGSQALADVLQPLRHAALRVERPIDLWTE